VTYLLIVALSSLLSTGLARQAGATGDPAQAARRAAEALGSLSTDAVRVLAKELRACAIEIEEQQLDAGRVGSVRRMIVPLSGLFTIPGGELNPTLRLRMPWRRISVESGTGDDGRRRAEATDRVTLGPFRDAGQIRQVADVLEAAGRDCATRRADPEDVRRSIALEVADIVKRTTPHRSREVRTEVNAGQTAPCVILFWTTRIRLADEQVIGTEEVEIDLRLTDSEADRDFIVFAGGSSRNRRVGPFASVAELDKLVEALKEAAEVCR
jgi:hypothetical protein